MVNTAEFIERLQKVLDYYGLSASAFADKIQVNRASISHLMSGRNKPSLDFVLKILDTFPEVELYWLLNGQGTFPKKPDSVEETSGTLFSNPAPPRENPEVPIAKVDVEPEVSTKQEDPIKSAQKKNIEKIIIFYTDGTFKTFIES
ncbi:DNA-binding transcriptional regulator, XRE-family HTH domain [Zhouia amylolytica]|uniref:DNA-binding transcriptional regulator, XRE-family HTH domain n=1 Tax=Zhouia amylolytica TaxID=376730 RepID=A0A1I6UJT5_9FLAO|nr:helix-turn-helix transcriptional regulator [Zhouia amylolytica]MCQ0112724.1 helix-turn-helix transcriptional regulator [Zhouia amylolytica]SFT01671.1 DNA-binding transcriptional regulator, XRE-family HTH domain [Zhouia amylolytica]